MAGGEAGARRSCKKRKREYVVDEWRRTRRNSGVTTYEESRATTVFEISLENRLGGDGAAFFYVFPPAKVLRRRY